MAQATEKITSETHYSFGREGAHGEAPLSGLPDTGDASDYRKKKRGGRWPPRF
jgi:hypothetical protein